MTAHTELSIAAVERDTGLGKDTLRVWERRYGFPQPVRDVNGERLYPAEQVSRLHLIKRLMDKGHRPGRLVASSEADLMALANTPPISGGEETLANSHGTLVATKILQGFIARLRAHDAAGLRQSLHQTMMRQGLQHFILNTIAPLNRAVGEAWMRGELEIFEEHLYTEQMKSLLRQAIANLPAGGTRPHIMLTTAPDEQHVLGLLMVEALLTLEGATCISLGTQTPLLDIRRAAEAHRVDIVALSFSIAFPSRQIAALLTQLRKLLPPTIALWAGGAGCERLPALDGITPLPRLEDALSALRAWQAPD